MKKFAFAFAFAFAAMPAFAQEIAAADPMPTAIAPETPVNPGLMQAFDFVCDSKAVLSDKAKTACATGQMPKVAKSGQTFRNTGIGAEFNTLIRNMEFLNG